MAKKRVIVVNNRPKASEEDVSEETWWEWFRYKYARYWYAVIALAVTLFSPLEVLRHSEWDIRVPLAVIVLMGLSLLFIYGYLKLFWGKSRFGDEESED